MAKVVRGKFPIRSRLFVIFLAMSASYANLTLLEVYPPTGRRFV